VDSFGIEIWPAVLVFARMGSFAMLLPGLGETFISPRFRLSVAFLMALVLAPAAGAVAPAIPAKLGDALGMIFQEMLIGLALGAAARLVMSALAMAGQIASLQTGLAMGAMFDPTFGGQTPQLQTFLGMLGLAAAMAANLHHDLIEAAWASYQRFPPGGVFPTNDWAQYAVMGISNAFSIAMQMSAPLLVFGFLYFAALGVLSRMLPQIQIFFVAQPAGVLLGLLVFLMSLSVAIGIFLESLERFALDWR
jgi:flagellar biosynthesis protein FliR